MSARPQNDLRANSDLLALVRTEFRTLPLRDLLSKPPRVLLGVTQGASDILADLDIHSVFDLATSAAFDSATKLVGGASSLDSPLYQLGAATADLVRETEAAGVALADLQYLPIKALDRVPEAIADAVAAALDVQSVRDMALYPPYVAARTILDTVFFPENAAGADPERPADLLPRTGEYPTERVQYTTLLLDEIPHEQDEPIVDLTGPSFKPLDLGVLAKADAGFKKTAFGALLTFNQSWFAQGVTLGQLLHSAALAPGESTRIAVVDWTRKSRAGETEVIAEQDDLTNDMAQNRSISEVTSAVADEAQGGFSESNTRTRSTQEGTSSAAELSAPFGGLFGGPSGSIGHTSSEATGQAHSDSYSTSWGHREIGSMMAQNINDRTHQHAHSNRSRRASVVKEVSQTEHEGVSTRVLANYNHMHALTVQYYEVVQVYRVEVSVARADRVVFIPVQLVDFTKDDIVRRFQGVLQRNAMSYAIREALRNLDTIEITPDRNTHFVVLGDTIARFANVALRSQTSLSAMSRLRLGVPELPQAEPAPTSDAAPKSAVAAQAATESAVAAQAATESAVAAQSATAEAAVAIEARGVKLKDALTVTAQMNDKLWQTDQTVRLAGLLNRLVLRPDSNALFLPTDVFVEGGAVDADGATLRVVFRTLQGAVISKVSPESPAALSNIGRISLAGSSASRAVEATVTLTLNRNGVRFPIELPAVQVAKGAKGETRVVVLKPGGVNENIKQHLMDHRMYYSQAVFRSLDATQLAFLLAGYGVTVDGKTVPVAQVVEPMPIRYVGNYLAFKMNSDPSSDESWAKWLDEKGIHLGRTKEDIVPLGTGGTFAEAVLGRSNSAEKLDITRFWNWQDSPTPLQPTEIAAIQTGSRATSEDTKPGSLSSPIINITSPASLPDPAGTAAVLSAIQNGNMFRDMSGLSATIGLTQAALQATQAGASTAGQQAGENMNNLLKANTERQRVAAEMITSLAKTAASAYTGGLAGGGGGGISGGGNHSQDGAKINYFDKTAGQGAPGAASSSGGGPMGTVTGGGPVAPVTGGGSSGGGSTSGLSGLSGLYDSPYTTSSGYSQNPAALAATWGDGQPRSALFEKALYTFASETGAEDLAGAAAAKNVQKKELNCVGEFAWDPAITDATEIAELAANRWAPQTDDFVAVVGGNALSTPSFGELLGAILSEADGSVARVNLFTHANKGMVAFSGHIQQGAISAQVMLNVNGPGDNMTAMDPTSMTNLSQPGVNFKAPKAIRGKTVFTVEDVRKKFAPGAMFVLYACHSGQAKAFMDEINAFFGIKVVGFTPVVAYFPPPQNVPNKFQRAGEKIGLGVGGTAVTDWRGLINDPSAITSP